MHIKDILYNQTIKKAIINISVNKPNGEIILQNPKLWIKKITLEIAKNKNRNEQQIKIIDFLFIIKFLIFKISYINIHLFYKKSTEKDRIFSSIFFIFNIIYSNLRASIGFSLAAFLAGSIPKIIPVKVVIQNVDNTIDLSISADIHIPQSVHDIALFTKYTIQ